MLSRGGNVVEGLDTQWDRSNVADSAQGCRQDCRERFGQRLQLGFSDVLILARYTEDSLLQFWVLPGSRGRQELQAGSDVIYMLSDMMRERVSIHWSAKSLMDINATCLLVTSNVGLASTRVCIIVILSLDQRLYLRRGSVELQPLFVDGLRYTIRCDTRFL